MKAVILAVASTAGMVAVLAARLPSAWADECCVFAEAFGADANDVALCTIVASDGSLVMTGYTDGGLGGKDIVFARFDSCGALLNPRYVYGGTQDEEGHCVVETDNGNFIVVGYTKSRGDGADFLVSEFNSSGVYQWTRTWGKDDGYDEKLYSVIKASDGTLWAAGYTASYVPQGDKKVVLAKVSSSGTTLTCSRAGKLTDDWGVSGYAVAEVFGDYPGFCVAGTVIDNDLIFGFGQEILLAKFSDTPSFWWARRYGVEEDSSESATSIVRTSDACLALAGELSWWDGIYMNYGGFLLKTDPEAHLDWARRVLGFAHYYSQKLTTVIETADANLAVVGYDHSGVWYDDRVALAKLDFGGALLWTKGHEIGDACVGNSLVEDLNGCLLAAGSTEGYGQGGEEALLVRYRPSGSTCLPEFEGPGFSSWSASEHEITLTGARFTVSTSAWTVQFSTYGNQMVVTPICCLGDIDGDGDTDHSDLGELLSAWGSRLGDSNWNPDADLDGDGQVGHGDLGMLLSDWGCGVGP